MGNVGIYKITSPSGRVYIGQSWDLKRRFERYRGLESKKQPKLHNSFLKYGVRQHELKIIHELPNDVTQEVLDIYEDIYMEQYRSCWVDLLNVKGAGSAGKHSESTKRKIGEKNRINMIGKKRGYRTEEHRMNLSLSQKGKKKNPLSVEKVRLAMIGKKASAETKAKMIASRSGLNNHNIKAVKDTKTGEMFISCREAATIRCIGYKNLSRYLNGSRNNPTSLIYI